jgi:hypothetical protein
MPLFFYYNHYIIAKIIVYCNNHVCKKKDERLAEDYVTQAIFSVHM